LDPEEVEEVKKQPKKPNIKGKAKKNRFTFLKDDEADISSSNSDKDNHEKSP